MRLYFFSLYRVLILYIVDMCEFYPTLRPYLSDGVRWTFLTQFCPQAIGQCMGSGCHGAGPREIRWLRQNVRNVKGHILGERELQIIPRLLGGARRECKSSNIIRDLRRNPPCIDPLSTPLSWVLKSGLHCCHCYYLEVFRGCLIELTALAFFLCDILLNHSLEWLH